MSPVVRGPPAGVGAQNGTRIWAQPLCPAPSIRAFYRRSTLIKAPRKRTFLVAVANYNPRTLRPTTGFTNKGAGARAFSCCCNSHEKREFLCSGATDDNNGIYGGGNNNSINNNSNNNNNNNNNNNRDWWYFGDDASRAPFPALGQALLGAIVLVATLAVFPAPAQAMQGSPAQSPTNSLFGGPFCVPLLSSSAPTRAPGFLTDPFQRRSLGAFSNTTTPTPTPPSPLRPRSKVMHVTCKGGTLVVPLPANDDPKSAAGMRLGPFSRTRIVDAPVVLSGREVALLDSAQYRVRESMRI